MVVWVNLYGTIITTEVPALKPLSSEAVNVHETELPAIVFDTFPTINKVESAPETFEHVRVYPFAFVTVSELVIADPVGNANELASYVKAAWPFPPLTDQFVEDEKSSPVGIVWLGANEYALFEDAVRF